MRTIKIDSTINTPEIVFDITKKTIMLQGNSLPEYGGTFYDDIEKHLRYFLSYVNNDLTIIFNLTYMNTTSNKRVLELFKICKNSVNNIKIIWKYSEDDEMMKEEGEIFEKILELKFEYIPITV